MNSADPLAGYKAIIKQQRIERMAKARAVKQQNDAARAEVKAQIAARKKRAQERFKAKIVTENFLKRHLQIIDIEIYIYF